MHIYIQIIYVFDPRNILYISGGETQACCQLALPLAKQYTYEVLTISSPLELLVNQKYI